VINRGLEDDGTLGFTFLDLIDHWAFSHGLLIVGLIECILIGWVYGVHKIRKAINEHSKYNLPAAYDWIVKLVIPILIGFVLGVSIYKQATDPGGLYGASFKENYTVTWSWVRWLPQIALGMWLVCAIGGATLLTFLRSRKIGSED